MTQKYPEARSVRTAIVTGSFNPFTVGHASIVERALKMFDRVVIAMGVNIEKTGAAEAEALLQPIRALYAGDSRVEVTHYSGLTATVAAETGACCIVKGVRNAADFEYERTMAEVNRRLCGIETLLMPALPEYQCVSSSMVRELRHFGADVSAFLPKPGVRTEADSNE